MALVGAEALGAEETVRGVNSWHIEREKSAATTGGQREPGRVDITTGWALLGLSALLTVGSYMVAGSMGGGPYFIAVGPLIYGFVRLFRGRAAQKAAEARMRE